jgi:hypothetical protein
MSCITVEQSVVQLFAVQDDRLVRIEIEYVVEVYHLMVSIIP